MPILDRLNELDGRILGARRPPKTLRGPVQDPHPDARGTGEGPRADGGPARRLVPELVAALGLAVLGSAVWPLAPNELPLHWDLAGYDNLAASWIALIMIPWSCAAVTAFLSSLSGYAERPKLRQFAQVSLVVSIADLVLALTFAAIYG